ncbi:MAG TPA: hypothetical protein VGP84_18445 [Gemmatimonadaceae bacterium]|jgi:hypothetical protein|nr:hypothetical protein [Gemmatimonadaceae bacterium]
MFRFSFVAASALALTVAACTDSGAPPTVPSTAPSLSDRSGTIAGVNANKNEDDSRTVRMFDDCDPASFDAALHDPNACIGKGKTTFDRFIAELTRSQVAQKWRFDPRHVEVEKGNDVFAINKGGEVHTFTRVANFGGGIVPILNTLSGNPTPAPECTTLEPDDFVAPGAMYTAELNTDKLQHFQCCIHPWMRADVRLKHADHDDKSSS